MITKIYQVIYISHFDSVIKLNYVIYFSNNSCCLQKQKRLQAFFFLRRSKLAKINHVI